MLNILYNIIIFPVEQIIELCYYAAFRISHSYGFSVLGVSLAVSTLVLPIYLMAEKQQRKEREKQKTMRGEINNIKAVFSGDKRYMLLSTLYRQNNYHPVFALRNSIDLFIQIPFFIAAYHFLHNLILLQNQPFFFIKDLGAPDGLLHGINILPILMTLINCVSGAIYTSGFPLKDKLQLYGMAAVFLLLLYNSPAALVLYWTGNNIYNLLKNVLQKMRHSGKIIKGLVSIASIALIIFLLFFHTGVLKKRLVASVILLFLASWPLWKNFFLSFVNKIRQKMHFASKTYILSCFIMFLLIGLVIPSALIASSVAEFSMGFSNSGNPVMFILSTMSQSAGFFIFWAFFVYFLADTKIKPVLTMALSALAVLAIINTFVFKGDYGTITNVLQMSNIDNHSRVMLTVSTIVNCAAVAVLFILAIAPQIILSSLQTIALVSCLVFGAINIASINKEYKALDSTSVKRNEIIPPEPEYTFSKTGRNVVLIMLDRAFSGYVPFILEEKPELKEAFSGFTFYPNTVSFMGHTIMGAPPVFGGYEYTPAEMNKRDTVPLVDKHNEALLVLPKLFLEKGFAVSVTDPPFANYKFFSDTAIFDSYPDIHAEILLGSRKYLGWWQSKNPSERQTVNVKKKLNNGLIRFSFFRAAIPLLREFIYDGGDYLEVQTQDELASFALETYMALDMLPEISKITEDAIDTYNCIYNDLPHQPSFLHFPDYDITKAVDALGKSSVSGEKYYHVNMASFLLLAKWIQYLKQNDVYDNTRIIIVADHGLSESRRDSKIYAATLQQGSYLYEYTPLLLFKDFYAKGSMRNDSAFMTNADVPLMALNGIVDYPVNPFTGNPLKTDKEGGVVITTSHLSGTDNHGKYKFSIKPAEWLHVHDDILNMSNWSSKQLF